MVIDADALNLLAQDKKNKLLELEYLEQIRLAQENNDTEAFKFFLQEYVDVERLDIPEELKKEDVELVIEVTAIQNKISIIEKLKEIDKLV